MADLPDIDLNSIKSILVKAACRLFWLHKKKETPYAELQMSDHAVVCQIIAHNLLASIRTDYFTELRHQIAVRFPTLYNKKGLNQLGEKAPIFLPEWSHFENVYREYSGTVQQWTFSISGLTPTQIHLQT